NTLAYNNGLTFSLNKPGSLWIRNKNWDLTFISLSAVLVLIPLVSYYVGHNYKNQTTAKMSQMVDYFVAAFIGGPHMFATYLRTFMDKGFVRSKPIITWTSLLIPVFVIIIGLNHLPLLLTIFFTFASIHVIQQILYIVDSYNNKAKIIIPKWEKYTDYFVAFVALLPWGVYMFVHDKFLIDGYTLLFPPFLKVEALVYISFTVFFIALGLFIYKTFVEIKEKRFNGPKTLLVSLTVFIGFWIPAVGLIGIPLDVSFQGFNIWHSFQYLGITAYILNMKLKRGEIPAHLVRRLSVNGWYFYGFNVLITLGLVSIMLLISPDYGFGLVATDSQARYLPTLSFLLIHYYHDNFLFKDEEALVPAGT
ncbi:MAG: hypothetical protein ACRDFC_10100, partial [Ignavibacteria bacterium]